jgi:hypothetical protein
MLNEKGLKDLI